MTEIPARGLLLIARVGLLSQHQLQMTEIPARGLLHDLRRLAADERRLAPNDRHPRQGITTA